MAQAGGSMKKCAWEILRKWMPLVLFLALSAYTIYWAMQPLDAPSWMGFVSYDDKLKSLRPKTLWDWYELLVVPGVIAFGVWWLNDAQKKKDRDIEEDKQRQTALDSYFGYMSKLILEKNLCCKSPDPQVYALARSKTLGLLRILDVGRKAQGLQFLCETGLLGKNPVVDLIGANLKGAHLSCATLNGVEIKGAYFCNADLSRASLKGAILRGCDFSGANLEDCDLTDADLTGAKFTSAKLNNVKTSNNTILALTDWPNK
jgi:hypothetical protein